MQVSDRGLADERGTRAAVPMTAGDARRPDSEAAPHLGPGEQLLDQRVNAAVIRVVDDVHSSGPMTGSMYLTNHRLLHVNGDSVSIELAEIEEIALAGDRLLVTLSGLHGLIIDLEEPGEFRTEVAAAMSALRGADLERARSG